MKQFTKVYFITVNGEPTYIGATPNKKLTLMTRSEAVLASATTAEPVFIDTVEGLKEFSRFYRKPIKSHHVRNGVLTVPKGNTTIEKDDHIMIVAKNSKIERLSDIFEY